MKRGYYLSIIDDSDVGDFVVANNIKHAKELFQRNGWLQDYDDWFLRMRVKWAKQVDVTGLPLGNCGAEDVTVCLLSDDSIACDICEDENGD